MASPSASQDRRPNGIDNPDRVVTPIEPATPKETGPQPDPSQVTLPSTEVPSSPIDVTQSFKTEMNDERHGATVIPSSMTPPPSSQIPAPHANTRRVLPPQQSQQSNFTAFSPPPTILQPGREAAVGSSYAPPQDAHISDATEDELRNMLRTSIAEHQKLKMETAHHKLQYNLLSMQLEEDSKRAAVEHDMIRREVDALRTAEHSRQARRELSTSADSLQSKYLQAKMWHEEAVEENEGLQRRVKVAKKVIQQKEEEVISLTEERDMLLNRIRENREHFHMLCSPGGMFHGAVPKQFGPTTPLHHRGTPRQPRSANRDDRGEGREHGLSALLQAMSQDHNTTGPSTPFHTYRPGQRQGGKHSRNAQSLSSLPTTPVHRARGEHASLLPSVDLVPQTEPAQRYANRYPETPRRQARRKSRESTISADDNEELARQAMESVAAVHSFPSQGSQGSRSGRFRSRRYEGEEDPDIYDSQASQAATEMLRRDPRQSFEVASSAESRDGSPGPGPGEKSSKVPAKVLSNLRGPGDKRKFSGGHTGGNDGADDRLLEQGSPAKKMRVGGPLLDNPSSRVGLGIQYRQ